MRESMTKLAGFLGRRRRLVLAAWIVTLIVALPIASHQTDHLTGGGFDVPGSQSKVVADAVTSDFASQTSGLGVVLHAAPDASPAQRDAALRGLRRDVAGIAHLSLAPADARRAEGRL